MEVIGHLDRQERLIRVNANQVAAAVFAGFEKNSKKMLEVEERGGKGYKTNVRYHGCMVSEPLALSIDNDTLLVTQPDFEISTHHN
jgi:hypothetical protein